MRLETFFDKFEQFAEAPNAVAKMRELVLELGVTGKLTNGVEVWSEAPLGEVVRLRRGYDLPTQSRKQGAFPIYAANGTVGVHNKPAVKGPGVVTGRSGSIGKVHFVPHDFWPLNTSLYVEDFFGNDPEFACLLLRSLHLERFSTATAVPTLNRNVVHKETVRIPPLAEQKRIVAKVDELMALCDRLEAQQQERAALHAALASAALARFADAPTPSNLDVLFHPAYAVAPADIRKTILTLAVQGKLVPQDVSDEPVSELRQKICAKVVGATNRTKSTYPQTSLIEDDERPYSLPPGWEWLHLGELLPEFQNGASSRGDKDGRSVVVLRLADINNRRISLKQTRVITIASNDIAKYTLRSGDVLITRVNGSADIVGSFIPVETDLDAIYCDHFIRMRIDTEFMYPSYISLIGETRLVRDQISSLFITTAGQKTVNQGHIGSLLIAVPPLAEQRRIVAKVDQLMALVDRLETELADSRIAAVKLMEAAVAELTAGDNQ